MHKAFNARFLIGLPLWRHDSIDLSRQMMELAEEYLPKEALLGFELGNEVGGVMLNEKAAWGAVAAGRRR